MSSLRDALWSKSGGVGMGPGLGARPTIAARCSGVSGVPNGVCEPAWCAGPGTMGDPGDVWVMPERPVNVPTDAPRNPDGAGPTPRPRSGDVFPATRRTWLIERLGTGGMGLSEANRHVMAVYLQPLRVYFMGSSFSWLGEPDELVQSFLADRLERDGYLARWLQSGRPLRYWLIVGFKHFLLEESRRRKRSKSAPLPADAPGTNACDPERAFTFECGRSIVAQALAAAESECRDSDLGDHWRIFLRHHLDGHDYSTISVEMGVEPQRAAVMARTAANRFRSSLRAILAWPGATREEIDDEIRTLLEAPSR